VPILGYHTPWNDYCYPFGRRFLKGRVDLVFFNGAAMDAINSLFASTLKQGVTALTSAVGLSKSSSTNTKSSKDFESTLKALLAVDGKKQASEEDVFSALVQERIKSTKGDDALKKFNELLAQSKEAMKKPDGFIPVEDATKDALRKFRDSGAVSKEDADSIYSHAFAAAQLDDNKEALYDDRGGPGDTSVAVASMEQALLSSRTKVAAFAEGTEKFAIRSLEEASAGKSGGVSGGHHTSEPGAGGFLFKPVSDSDGKLAILLPPKLSGLVSGVRLVGPNGETIESGRYAGNGNGGRDHFRFNRPGGGYPNGLTVEVALKTGEIVRYLIQETSQRTENITPSNGGSSSGGSENTGGSAGGNTDSTPSKQPQPDNSL
jgi:hypothetical protein